MTLCHHGICRGTNDHWHMSAQRSSSFQPCAQGTFGTTHTYAPPRPPASPPSCFCPSAHHRFCLIVYAGYLSWHSTITTVLSRLTMTSLLSTALSFMARASLEYLIDADGTGLTRKTTLGSRRLASSGEFCCRFSSTSRG